MVAMPRTTISVKPETTDKGRRLARAMESKTGNLPSMDDVVELGFRLLEKYLRSKKVKIPRKAKALRCGPKQRSK